MHIEIFDSAPALGEAAASTGAAALREAIARTGSAAAVLATGASQFATLDALVRQDVDWSRVTVFHLDE